MAKSAPVAPAAYRQGVMLMNMNGNLKQHELIVLDTLASGVISTEILKEIKDTSIISNYDVTDNGYFLTIKHPSLPLERTVCNEPMLIGQCGDIETGFIVFIENGELTIECHGWGEIEIPTDFRDSEITIRRALQSNQHDRGGPLSIFSKHIGAACYLKRLYGVKNNLCQI